MRALRSRIPCNPNCLLPPYPRAGSDTRATGPHTQGKVSSISQSPFQSTALECATLFEWLRNRCSKISSRTRGCILWHRQHRKCDRHGAGMRPFSVTVGELQPGWSVRCVVVVRKEFRAARPSSVALRSQRIAVSKAWCIRMHPVEGLMHDLQTSLLPWMV